MWRMLLVVLCTSIVPVAVAAQPPRPPVVDGDRVRVTTPTLQGVFVVVASTADTLALRQTPADGAPTLVPWQDVTRLDVRRRRSQGAGGLRGAGIGFVTGAVSGAVLGFASGDDDPSAWLAFTAGEKAAVAGIAFGGVGLLVGGIIGLVAPGERWDAVDLREGVRVSPGRGGGITLSYAVPF